MTTNVKFIVEVSNIIGANDSEKQSFRNDSEAIIREKKSLFNSIFNNLIELKQLGEDSIYVPDYSVNINGLCVVYGERFYYPSMYLKNVDENSFAICLLGINDLCTKEKKEFSIDELINILSLRNLHQISKNALNDKKAFYEKKKRIAIEHKKGLMLDMIKGSDKLTLNINSMNERKNAAFTAYQKEIVEIERIKKNYISESAEIFGNDLESKEIFIELLNSLFS